MWSTPDDVPVALLRVRSDGTASAANRAWCELTGLTIDQSLGSGWLGFLATVDLGPVLDTISLAAGSGRTVRVELSGGAAPLSCLARGDETGPDVVVAVVPDVVRRPRSGPETAIPPEVVAVIHELYAVSLGLASCLNLVDDRAGHRISTAIDRLDHVVRRLRTAVVEDHRRAAHRGAPAPLVPEPRGG